MNVTIGGENGQCTVEKVGNEYLVAFGVCFGLMKVVQPQMGVVEDDVVELGGWKPVKQGCGVDVVQDCCTIGGLAELLEVGGGRGVGGLQFLLRRVRGGSDCNGAVLETSRQRNGVGEIAVPDGQDGCGHYRLQKRVSMV